MARFAISCPDDLWVTGTVLAGGKPRLILGVKKWRTVYSTRKGVLSRIEQAC